MIGIVLFSSYFELENFCFHASEVDFLLKVELDDDL